MVFGPFWTEDAIKYLTLLMLVSLTPPTSVLQLSRVLSLLWTLQRASQRYEICLEQCYTLSNTDLFVKASDGGLKLTYPDVNKYSKLPAARFYAQ